MKCPTCSEANLAHDTRDLPYTYKGETTLIPAVTGDFCPACGEVILDPAESARTSSLMMAFNRQVNASTVDPEFILRVRKSSHSTNAKPPRSSAAASTHSPATRTAKPSPHRLGQAPPSPRTPPRPVSRNQSLIGSGSTSCDLTHFSNFA